MSLELSGLQFIGSAFPEPFVKFDLEKILNDQKLLPKNTGQEGEKLQEIWSSYRRRLRDLVSSSGSIRVKNCIIDPLVEILGYDSIEKEDKVTTREGQEDGGYLLRSSDGKNRLRVWTAPVGIDLASPVKRGYAYRFSLVKIAQRVLFTCQERVGIITDGQELRILISDPARTDSEVIISVDPEWKRSYHVPDTFRFFIAITCPKGIDFLPELLDKARLKQSTVTKELRVQARRAIEGFIQGIIEDPLNKPALEQYEDKDTLAKVLWREGLIVIYRLLFILKGEASDDPAKAFGFTGSTIWRNTFSPTTSLSYYVRKCLDENVNTGNFLEQGLKTIFKIFKEGVKSTELNIAPLGGALFGADSTPLLSKLHWPEKACAYLLDQLLWTIPLRGRRRMARQRIHYGSLQISDLGNIYELLLELEPGIAQERMCRLRRSKLEVVVPYQQGEKYKQDSSNEGSDSEGEEENQNEENDTRSTKIKWIEEIRKGKFYLRTGLGKKSSGSYYTPESFVRFLVQETLGPKIEEVSPRKNPYPNKILQIKVLDPAMGSGHFLVNACAFMAEKLYEACRFCDEKALELENKLQRENDDSNKEEIKKEINSWRNRILEIPDPEDEILRYLPSSAPEAWRSGLSQAKAQALCKRLVAVHCLYGVDKNPLAVELAKLSLWLETQSEGLPLTFLDHRLVLGDSITGPFFEHLLKYPGKQQPLEDIFTQGVQEKLKETLKNALVEIKELEKSIGIDLSDMENKKTSKRKLEDLLLPFKILAAAWAGGVMLGVEGCDDLAYGKLAKAIAEEDKLPDNIESEKLLLMISNGLGIEEENLSFQDILTKVKEGKTIPALPYDLTFPEVFFELTNGSFKKKGFDVVLGNPPWDAIRPQEKEFFGNIDIETVAARTAKVRTKLIKKYLEINKVQSAYNKYIGQIEAYKKAMHVLYKYQLVKVEGSLAGRYLDHFRIFCERIGYLTVIEGLIGLVISAAFHYNEGATGIRKYFLNLFQIHKYYSFENRKKIFDIYPLVKFSVIILQKRKLGDYNFEVAFNLLEEDALYENKNRITFAKSYIFKTSLPYLTFYELSSQKDVEILNAYAREGERLEDFCNKNNMQIMTEPAVLNATSDSHLFENYKDKFQSIKEPRFLQALMMIHKNMYLPVREGKTFYQYKDIWAAPTRNVRYSNEIRFVINISKLLEHNQVLKTCVFYRFGLRTVSGTTSSNERIVIGTLFPPGYVFTNSIAIDAFPQKRPTFKALLILSFLNSFPFEWAVRFKAWANLNLFILKTTFVPKLIEQQAISYICHAVTRLVSEHEGFLPLWHEQLGNNWREPNKKPFTWPVLETEEERWHVRSAIDAVVAEAYGLNREQYEHILKSFDRASGPNPYTGICLEKFDELKKIGLDKFTKKYDPYWDIPLNEELPKPVIDLPIPEERTERDIFGNVVTVSKKRGRRR